MVPQAAVAGRDREPADRLAALVDRLDEATATARTAQQVGLAHQQRVLAVLSLLIVAVLLCGVAMVVLGIVRPLRRLAHEADRAAAQTLPAAIARIMALPADADPPAVSRLHVGTGDELEELGRALSALQTTALDLALQQRRAAHTAEQTLVNLGRRGQNLVEQARRCIEELGGVREDPVVAAGLTRLDGATNRMGRSAESMLVLGGASTQALRFSRPVPMAEIVHAALGVVEDGSRIDLHHVEEAAVIGTAVGDLIHLLAELVENAVNFSPPDVRVTVVGRFASYGRYGLHVVDHGIGMTSHELAQANARIARAASTANLDTHRLGLHVVGRLAARIGAEVTLRPSTDRGVTAQVDVPSEVVIDIERTEAGHDSWTPPRGAAQSAAAGDAERGGTGA